MNEKLAYRYAETYRDLFADTLAFVKRFDAWIKIQDEHTQVTSALAFGREYETLREWFEPDEKGDQ